MNKRHLAIILALFYVSFLTAQNSILDSISFPFESFLKKINTNDSLAVELEIMNLQTKKFNGCHVVQTIDSINNWSLIGFVRSSGTFGRHEFNSREVYLAVNNENIIESKIILDIFNLRDSQKSRLLNFSQLSSQESFSWTPFYCGDSEDYLIIEKSDVAIGNEISYDDNYKYYFKKLK